MIEKTIEKVVKIIGILAIIMLITLIILVSKRLDKYEWHNGACRKCNHYLKFDCAEYVKYAGTVYKYYCPNCNNRIVTHTHFEPIVK